MSDDEVLSGPTVRARVKAGAPAAQSNAKLRDALNRLADALTELSEARAGFLTAEQRLEHARNMVHQADEELVKMREEIDPA